MGSFFSNENLHNFYEISDSHSQISLTEVISLLQNIFSKKYPNAGVYFDFCLENGNFDFLSSPDKVPNSFTSFHKGKNPKILLHFS